MTPGGSLLSGEDAGAGQANGLAAGVLRVGDGVEESEELLDASDTHCVAYTFADADQG